MDSKQNQTLLMLRELWVEGNKVFIAMESNDFADRHNAGTNAVRWLEQTKVYFKKLFYNQSFYDEYKKVISGAYDNYDNFSVNVAMNLSLGHIHGLGKMLKFGYVKDQFSGINNEASKICFVAMSFAEEHEDIYTVGIKPAVEALGYDAVRVDKIHHNEKNDSKIFELINQSRFVVADFTGQRTGVYYEAGYAKGIGLPVVQTCQQNDFNNLHFDVKTISTIEYHTPSKLRELLKTHVAESIGKYTPVIKSDIDSVPGSDIPF